MAQINAYDFKITTMTDYTTGGGHGTFDWSGVTAVEISDDPGLQEVIDRHSILLS